MPGYTHLQRAQPVTLGHHLLAWVEMLDRDRDRFALAAAHAEPSPLGAGALAGTTLPLPGVRNSLDAVADRDFALDYLYACAGAVRPPLADRRGAGPVGDGGVRVRPAAGVGGDRVVDDAAEAQPGRRGARPREGGDGDRAADRAARDGQGAPARRTTRDLGEDKPAAFAARRDVRVVLSALVVLVRDLRFDEERLEAAAGDPALLATDAAEALVAEGVPFRDAHEQVARAVREGAFDPDSTAAESAAARLGDVGKAVAEARKRFVRALVGTVRSGRDGCHGLAQRESAAPERAADDRALAAEVAEGDEVVERRDPAGREHRHSRRQHLREQPEVGAARASRRGGCS